MCDRKPRVRGHVFQEATYVTGSYVSGHMCQEVMCVRRPHVSGPIVCHGPRMLYLSEAKFQRHR